MSESTVRSEPVDENHPLPFGALGMSRCHADQKTLALLGKASLMGSGEVGVVGAEGGDKLAKRLCANVLEACGQTAGGAGVAGG